MLIKYENMCKKWKKSKNVKKCKKIAVPLKKKGGVIS